MLPPVEALVFVLGLVVICGVLPVGTVITLGKLERAVKQRDDGE